MSLCPCRPKSSKEMPSPRCAHTSVPHQASSTCPLVKTLGIYGHLHSHICKGKYLASRVTLQSTCSALDSPLNLERDIWASRPVFFPSLWKGTGSCRLRGGGSVGCFQTHSRRWQLDCVEQPPCGRAHCPHRKQEEVMGAPFRTLLPRNLSRPWSPRIYCTRWHRGLSMVIFMMRSAQRLAIMEEGR